MTTIRELASTIRSAMVELDELEGKVQERVDRKVAADRAGEMFVSSAALFIYPTMSPSVASWRNMGPDFHLCRLGYTAWEYRAAQLALLERAARMQDGGPALGANAARYVAPQEESGWPNKRVLRTFDFRWNMHLASSSKMYGSGGSGMLSRQSLGNMETGNWWRSPDPEGVLVPGGETIMFPIAPMGYFWDWDTGGLGNPPQSRFTVHMLLRGYRTW